MKKKLSTVLLILTLFVGLSILLYPLLADYWNSRSQTKAIVDYDEMLSKLTPQDFSEQFEKAERYNKQLVSIKNPLGNDKEPSGYNETLNADENGVIGYILIEKIGVELPIYHGVSDVVLNVAVGHLQGTSLPIGGESTHAVLSAHRGLPSAMLFTDLDKMAVGDTFIVTVLDRVLTYEVDKISIVEPQEVDALSIVEGEDHCSLVTCTPYGVNTHRLIVRGTRTETVVDKPIINVANDAYRINPLIVALIIALPLLLLLLIVLLLKPGTRKRK